MKTEDFIAVLAADEMRPAAMAQRLARGLPLGLALSALAFLISMGLRPNMGGAEAARAVAMKLGVTLPFALAGLVCAWRLMQPGRPLGARALLFVVPMAVLAGALTTEMQRRGMDQFAGRLFGENYWRCLLAIPLLSLAPLAALLFALRAGAPVAPGRAGLLAGLAAAGLGASLYALHCPDDSPLFILAWYSLASLLMAGLGAALGRRVLAW